MNNLRWVMAVPCLLLIGLAASPSEAVVSTTVPTLTIKTEDGTFNVPFTSTGACGATDAAAGYTACYPIKTGSYPNAIDNNYTGTNTWTISSDTGTTARLLVTDNGGTADSPDVGVLTGVKFQPNAGATNLGFKLLSVTYTITFDATPKTAGAYSFARRAGGNLIAGTDGSNIGDSVNLSATGWFGLISCPDNCVNVSVTFSPTLALSPDTINVPGPKTPFTLKDTKPYPTFNCNTSGEGNSCRPIITQVLDISSTKRDAILLTNSAEGVGTIAGDFIFDADSEVGRQVNVVLVPGTTIATNQNAMQVKLAGFAKEDRQYNRANGVPPPPTRCKRSFDDDDE